MTSSWPPVAAEKLTWMPAHADDFGPGLSAYLGAPREYEASVPPLIADVAVTLPDTAVTAAEEARRELSRFDAELGHRVAAFGPVLLRSEAAASSQIEQLTASARAILTAELTGHAARNATLVAANTRTARRDRSRRRHHRRSNGPDARGAHGGAGPTHPGSLAYRARLDRDEHAIPGRGRLHRVARGESAGTNRRSRRILAKV